MDSPADPTVRAMTHRSSLHHLISALVIGTGIATGSPGLDDAEVRLPYRELKQLLANAQPPAAALDHAPPPALLAARLRLGVSNGMPQLEFSCLAASFGGGRTLIPLLGGDITLEKAEPADAVVIFREKALCLVTDSAGSRPLTLRLLAVTAADGFQLNLEECPSVMLETGALPDGSSYQVTTRTGTRIMGPNQTCPLSADLTKIRLKLLDPGATREALSPPQPSSWTWQHQALVRAQDDGLTYQLQCRAAATGGSGVSAILPLPTAAREITVTGDDLASHRIERSGSGAPQLHLEWTTRGILDRRIALGYRLPQAPLDRVWKLQAPGEKEARTRFIVAADPTLTFAAKDLSPPCHPAGLAAELATMLHGAACHILETGVTADLTVTPVPVAATAEGEIATAEWALKIEPDGAMLAIGRLALTHRGPFSLLLDTPDGMKLLSCQVAGKPVSPLDAGDGKLQINLPAGEPETKVEIAFTGRTTALDPVTGTLTLALPRTPVFIHALTWNVALPAGLQAETSGNLTRLAPPAGRNAPHLLNLHKNLCRDERPEVRVFYQRAGLAGTR